MKILFFLFCLFFIVPFFGSALAQSPEDTVFEATVIKVIDESKIIESDGTTYDYQKLELIGTSGELKDKNFFVESGQLRKIGTPSYNAGDNVVVSKTTSVDGRPFFSITDYVRRNTLLFLSAFFVILVILIGGRRGASSILGMIITFAVLFLVILPQISKGAEPVLITSLSAAILIPITFLLAHGFNKKTFCAITGTLIALALTGVLAKISIDNARLTGFASEEAAFLDTLKSGMLDIKGLLFAGIIIALLGILEDITISQSAIVFQLKKANKKLHAFELFKIGMRVGQDHIASMSNTLILVYAGASLPLLLLFLDNPQPLSLVINNEVIAEEIIRTMVASIGLIIAVPITTIIASFIAAKSRFKD